MKVGIGYDIHRFVEDRKLIIGGVEIPFAKGLDGHSDADVLLHAICDALLGALGKGDIGEHFPNTNQQYKDISSVLLLKKVHELIQQEGFKVENIDAVLQAQEPNFKDYKMQMKKIIAQTLSIDDQTVNIKATTQEGLGSIGNGEGIAAFASVLIDKQ